MREHRLFVPELNDGIERLLNGASRHAARSIGCQRLNIVNQSLHLTCTPRDVLNVLSERASGAHVRGMRYTCLDGTDSRNANMTGAQLCACTDWYAPAACCTVKLMQWSSLAFDKCSHTWKRRLLRKFRGKAWHSRLRLHV